MIHSGLNLLGRYSCLQHRFCGRYSIYNKAGHFLYQSRHCTNILTVKRSCWEYLRNKLSLQVLTWGRDCEHRENKELWSKAQMELEALLSEQGKLLLIFHEEKCWSGERYDHGTSLDTSMIWAGSYFSHQISSPEQRFVRRESYVDHIRIVICSLRTKNWVLCWLMGLAREKFATWTLLFVGFNIQIPSCGLYSMEWSAVVLWKKLPPCNSRQDRVF